MQTDQIIRFATRDDLPSITEIYNQAIRSGGATAHIKEQTLEERSQWFAAFHPDRYPIYVLEREGIVAGYAYLCAYRPGREALGKVAEVSFYVDNRYHRQGIGSALLRHVIEDSSRLGIETLLAFLLEVNTSSIHLLNGFGFKEWGVFPNVAELQGQRCSHLVYGLKI